MNVLVLLISVGSLMPCRLMRMARLGESRNIVIRDPLGFRSHLFSLLSPYLYSLRLYQVCTTWGFFQTAPPIPQPPHLSGPKLISSLIDLEFSSEVCRKGFPPGEFSSVPAHPNVSGVNDIGGFNLEYERLAFIDGQFDPWRSACVHSEDYAFGGDRKDTLEKPFKLIPDCWHHCDENGLDSTSRKEGKEPERIRKIHEEILEFVKFWLDGWEKPKKA